MKRFNKIYLEISNVCNLSCAFCPGTKRPKHIMTEAEFTALMPKLRPWADYLYFHLMGEPLLHPHLARFLAIAGEWGFKVILTTNGTLLKKQKPGGCDTAIIKGALRMMGHCISNQRPERTSLYITPWRIWSSCSTVSH